VETANEGVFSSYAERRAHSIHQRPRRGLPSELTPLPKVRVRIHPAYFMVPYSFIITVVRGPSKEKKVVSPVAFKTTEGSQTKRHWQVHYVLRKH
jgi:hypothetical protein